MAYLEIILGAVAAFALGFVWYTALFGKTWQAETGITDEQAQSNMLLTHGTAFIMMCVMSSVINFVINMHDVAEQTFTHGAFHGAMLAAMFAAPAAAINYSYQKKSLKLFAIDAGYLVALCAVSGGVMAWLKFGSEVLEASAG